VASNFTLFTVSPRIPEKLAFLETLSNNMWYCWNHDAFDLFRRLDPDEWKRIRANPKRLLYQLPQSRFEEVAANESFLNHLSIVQERYEEAVSNHLNKLPSGCSIGRATFDRGLTRPAGRMRCIRRMRFRQCRLPGRPQRMGRKSRFDFACWIGR